MIQLSKIFVLSLTVSSVMLITGLTGTATAELTPAWGDTFPLKQSRDEVYQREGRTREYSPPASELHLIERETEVRRDQIDPLHAVVRIDFPAPRIQNVRQATQALLKPMGYTLLDGGGNTSALLQDLLDSPLPEVQRRFVDVRASEVLRALAGVGYIAVVDHVRRRVTYDPMPLYLSIGGNAQSDSGWTGERRIAPSNADERLFDKPLAPVQPQGWDDISETGEAAGWQAVAGFDADAALSRVRANPRHAGLASDPAFRKKVLSQREQDGSDERFVSGTHPGPGSVFDILVPTMTTTRTDALAREAELRKVASVFEADSDTLTITSCVPGQTQARIRRAQERLILALVRLGVARPFVRQLTPMCHETGATLAQGLSHIALSRAPTGTRDGFQ